MLSLYIFSSLSPLMPQRKYYHEASIARLDSGVIQI